MEMSNYIYLITNTKTDKKYIYPTRGTEEMIEKADIIDQAHGLELLIDDYGKDAFTYELLEKLGTDGFGAAINRYCDEYEAKMI